MNKSMALIISAMVLIVLGVSVLSIANSRITGFSESGNESTSRIACQRQQTLVLKGEVSQESLSSKCSVDKKVLERKRRLASALSGLN